MFTIYQMLNTQPPTSRLKDSYDEDIDQLFSNLNCKRHLLNRQNFEENHKRFQRPSISCIVPYVDQMNGYAIEICLFSLE